MTGEQSSYVPFKNRQRNSCDRASQDVAFDLEKYGPYIDKIRALFVPSLEYRIRSLLEEFVYSTDSRSARRFPRFKRLVDAMATWKGPLDKIAEYDVGTMEEAIGSIVNCALKDDLIICFLDSIVLHHRLSKICRELDALGLEDNILRNLSVWNLMNERDRWANRDRFTHPDAAANCNTDPSVTARHDAERPAGREEVVEPLTTSDVYCAGSAEPVRAIAPDCWTRERPQDVLLDSDRGPLRQAEGGNRSHQVHPATGSRRDDTDEARQGSHEIERAQSASRLKLTVRRVHLENYGCSTFSRPVVTCLPLPCQPGDLIGRIFEADPSLTESCLIVMRRKFQVGVSNVCSCLNDVLGKLNAVGSRLTGRTLHLSCEIRPGYISFKLKSDGAAGSRKYLFVARIPICQNVHKRTAYPPDVAASSSGAKLRDELEESECSGQRLEGIVDTDLNDALARVEDESERVDDTCCSQFDRNVLEDTTADRSRGKVEDSDAEETSSLCSINGNIPKRDYEFRICAHNERSDKILETVSDVTPRHTGDSERGSEERCKSTAGPNVIDCDRNTGEGGKEVPEIDNSTVRNDEPARLASDTNCPCLPYGDPAETKHEVEDIVSDEELDGSSQSADLDGRDWRSSSSKESDSGSTACGGANTSSITSFARDSERDKQLVELNCNRFSDNNVAKAKDERRASTVHTDPLDSTRAELGCDSDCFCRYDDFVDITVIGDDASSEGKVRLATFRGQSEATKQICYGTARISSKGNNTISVQTPRLRVSSKGISVDISWPRTVARLALADRNTLSDAKTRDKCDGAADLAARCSAVPRKGDVISHHEGKEVVNARGFIRPRRSGGTVSKQSLRSNAAPRQAGVSTQEDPRAGDRRSISLASNTWSPTCPSFATGGLRLGRFEKSRGSRKLRLRYVRAVSSSGVRSVTSVTTVKYRTTPRKRHAGCPADTRPQAAIATNRFRRSVDKSVRWMKRLVRSKLAGAFFSHERAKTASTSRTFGGSDESAGGVERRIAGTYVRQGFRVTPCSNPRERGCTLSHVESSDVTPPSRRNWGEKRSEGGMKLRDRRLAGGSEVLSSFRSIDTASPWSYDLLTPALEDLEAGERLDGGSGRGWRRGRGETENKRSLANRKKNSRGRDHGNYEESITISLRSAAVSLADGDSAGRLECSEQGKKPRPDGRRGRDWRASEGTQRQAGRRGHQRRREPREIGKVNDEFSELSSARWTRHGARDRGRERSHCGPRSRNMRRPWSLGEREASHGDAAMDHLRRRRVFALLADTCHDCARDLDLEFECALSRYVDLCRNVKRSLMRTLWPSDVHEVSAPSTVADS